MKSMKELNDAREGLPLATSFSWRHCPQTRVARSSKEWQELSEQQDGESMMSVMAKCFKDRNAAHALV